MSAKAADAQRMDNPAGRGGRDNQKCFCCGSPEIAREWAAISPFFARRALGRGPEPVVLIHCKACATRYFDFTPSEAELARLYRDYRGEEYFTQRNGFEPWYTAEDNADLGAEDGMRLRRLVLAKALNICGIGTDFGKVLDHVGDRGQMLRELTAPVKTVFDISGATPEPGVTAISRAELEAGPWDLILCCHVLEHLPDPVAYLVALLGLGRPGTVYFFEVPKEDFRSFWPSTTLLQNYWMEFVVTRPRVMKYTDLVSGAVQHRWKMLPPLLLLPLREHLSFFSRAGLGALLKRSGFAVRHVQLGEAGPIVAVAQKP